MKSDTELLDACLAGNRQAFGQIVERYQSLVCAVAYSRTGDLALSEDVAQETFLKAWRRLRQVRDASRLRGWLCTIARNLAGDWTRRRRRDVAASAASLRAADAVPAAAPAPPERAISREQEAVLWQAVEQVPETYREPLVLYHREGQSVRRVAELLDISEDAVRQRLSRGRRALKEQVATFVEGALAKTRPAGTFGVGVMAALAATSTKTTAAASAGGMGIAKVGAMLAGAVAVGVASGVGIRYALQDEPAPAPQPPVVAAAAPDDAQVPAAPPWKPSGEPLSCDLSAVAGMDALKDAGDAARDMLARNGFVVLPKYYHQIFSPYVHASLSPFVTMDSLHRTFHVILEEQVKTMETALAPEVAAISKEMRDGLRAERAAAPVGDGRMQALLLAEGYFAVGLRLLGEDVEGAAPDKRVVDEVRLIEAAAGVAASPLFGYAVDYSQFKPRGFYNDSALLQRFFRAMTWYGDMAFRQCSPQETRAAMEIAERFGAVRERWERIDRLYGHFIGPSDDLTPAEYADVAARTGGDLEAFRPAVVELREPKYNSMVIDPALMAEWRKWTKGMRFFGKRYLPDGEVFMALAYARPPKLLPSGLDMAAANGSPRAQELLQAQGALDDPETARNLASLQRKLADLKSSKQPTHYVEFLRLTEALWAAPPDGAPPCMKTAAYADKNLTTALAAWASMRHTWQLQGKQSVMYAGMTGPVPPGYVEPNIEFMQRLEALTKRTADILKDVKGADLQRLDRFRSLVADVRAIARKQLDGQPLVGKDTQLLDSYGPTIAGLMYFEGNSWLSDRALPWMSLIADVHTEHLTAETLQVGTGGAMPIYAVVPVDGKPHLMVGGVYSYYEFSQPLAERLTDAAWRQCWEAGSLPPAPPWTGSYVPGADVGPLLEKLKQGEIAEALKYASDPRVAQALKDELAPGGAFAQGEKREQALGLLAARIGRDAMPLLKEAASRGVKRFSSPVATALALLATPEELEEFRTCALTSTGPDAAAYAQVFSARCDADAFRTLTEVHDRAASPRAKDVAFSFLYKYGGRAATPMFLKWAKADGKEYAAMSALAGLWGKRTDSLTTGESLLPALTPPEEKKLRERVVAFALEQLESAGRDERHKACDLAAALDAPEAVPALEKMVFVTGGDDSVWAQRALVEMDCPEAAPVLVRMLDLPKAEVQNIVHALTYKRKYQGAWPALVKMLDNQKFLSSQRRVCDYGVRGLARLDPDGPGYCYFHDMPRADADNDRLVQCWRTYAQAKKGGGPAALPPAARAQYAGDLLALAQTGQSLGRRLGAGDVSFKWAMQAARLAETLPKGDERDTLSDRSREILVKLTQAEVLWIEKLFERYYKRDFGDYPPQTPGHWERVLAERHIATVDKSRCNAAGQLCDPWGNPYRYLRTAKHSDKPFEIYSFGPNRRDDDGAGDDIVSWK